MCVCVSPQVFLGPNGEVEEYSVVSIQQNSAIRADLILDQREEHLFVMTHNMVGAPHTEPLRSCRPGSLLCAEVPFVHCSDKITQRGEKKSFRL